MYHLVQARRGQRFGMGLSLAPYRSAEHLVGRLQLLLSSRLRVAKLFIGFISTSFVIISSSAVIMHHQLASQSVQVLPSHWQGQSHHSEHRCQRTQDKLFQVQVILSSSKVLISGHTTSDEIVLSKLCYWTLIDDSLTLPREKIVLSCHWQEHEARPCRTRPLDHFSKVRHQSESSALVPADFQVANFEPIFDEKNVFYGLLLESSENDHQLNKSNNSKTNFNFG